MQLAEYNSLELTEARVYAGSIMVGYGIRAQARIRTRYRIALVQIIEYLEASREEHIRRPCLGRIACIVEVPSMYGETRARRSGLTWRALYHAAPRTR